MEEGLTLIVIIGVRTIHARHTAHHRRHVHATHSCGAPMTSARRRPARNQASIAAENADVAHAPCKYSWTRTRKHKYDSSVEQTAAAQTIIEPTTAQAC
jgi:hypothetical protein